ncbi:MAG TPA: cytochrome c [Burkholderiales bacterium]|nr:cytochrome c [Burkholderiales bacterium]
MIPRIALGAVLALTAFTVDAQDDALARSLTATCASCHGTDGRSVTREVPALAGQPKEFLVSQMKAFQDGKRPATVMHQIAKGYTDAQIDLLAGYLSAQKK